MGLYGAIEAGGTKFLCAVGTGPGDLRAIVRIPTMTPEETLGRVIAFFQGFRSELRAIGVGAFGPLDLNPNSPTFGTIPTTPKPGWSGVNLLKPLREAFRVPIRLETDVNAAALGEGRWGAAQGLETFVYLTVGTGIGGGAMVHGRLLHGALHPEMGHIRIPHDQERDPFPGVCPFHGDCLEGLASGPALEARWGQPPESLPEDHPGWELEAEYLALGLVDILCVLIPERIILGGGVMRNRSLFPRIRGAARDEVILKVEGLSTSDKLKDISFEARAGEVLGFFGLMGAGRTELAKAIVGFDPIRSGRISIGGQPLSPHDTRTGKALGIGLLTEDRKSEGLLLELPVLHNMSLASLESFSRAGFVDEGKERSAVQAFVDRFRVKTPSLD
ncbi:MAG: ROK family protein, partial [Thermoflexus sp.]